MEKFYIFLDVDGVLNRERDWAEGRSFVLDRGNVETFGRFLAALQEQFAVRILLSSTWRYG